LDNGLYDVPPGRLATVVTYLEMTQPAPLRPRPAPQGSTLEPVRKPGLDWYRDLFTRVGGHDWLWFSRLNMTDQALSTILNDPKVAIWALSLNGQTQGLLELDFREESACELAFLGVTSELIGTGAGRYLMNEAISRAWAAPIDRFHVHTCTLDHPAALPTYKKAGFVQFKEEKIRREL